MVCDNGFLQEWQLIAAMLVTNGC